MDFGGKRFLSHNYYDWTRMYTIAFRDENYDGYKLLILPARRRW